MTSTYTILPSPHVLPGDWLRQITDLAALKIKTHVKTDGRSKPRPAHTKPKAKPKVAAKSSAHKKSPAMSIKESKGITCIMCEVLKPVVEFAMNGRRRSSICNTCQGAL